MFSKKKKNISIDNEQHELFEHARKRIVQKKMLFRHFILFIIGSLFSIVLNLILGIGKSFTIANIDWFVIVIVVWAFFLVLHFCNVWLFSTFMGAEWTEQQMKKLVIKQKAEIANLQKEVDLKHPKPEIIVLQDNNTDTTTEQ